MSTHEYSLHFLVNELVRTLKYGRADFWTNTGKSICHFSVNLKGANLAPESIVDYFNRNTTQQANTYTPVRDFEFV